MPIGERRQEPKKEAACRGKSKAARGDRAQRPDGWLRGSQERLFDGLTSDLRCEDQGR